MDNDATLRRHGTAQRPAVLPAVPDRRHGTADDLSTVVDRRHLTPGAVYDALGVLIDKGVLRRIQPASAVRAEGDAPRPAPAGRHGRASRKANVKAKSIK